MLIFGGFRKWSLGSVPSDHICLQIILEMCGWYIHFCQVNGKCSMIPRIRDSKLTISILAQWNSYVKRSKSYKSNHIHLICRFGHQIWLIHKHILLLIINTWLEYGNTEMYIYSHLYCCVSVKDNLNMLMTVNWIYLWFHSSWLIQTSPLCLNYYQWAGL